MIDDADHNEHTRKYFDMVNQGWEMGMSSQNYGAYYPGGHNWDYCPGGLYLSQVTAIHLKIRHP